MMSSLQEQQLLSLLLLHLSSHLLLLHLSLTSLPACITSIGMSLKKRVQWMIIALDKRIYMFGNITMDTNPAYATTATIKMDTNLAYATTSH